MSTTNLLTDHSPTLNPPQISAYCALPHTELNISSPQTLLLIHGAFDTARSWNTVTPHLSPHYHLLIPDLPGHGLASHIRPFSIATSALLLRELILRKAHNSVAVIVGFSLGAAVAVELISHYPEVVDGAAFLSGYSAPPTSPPSRLLPYLAWLEARIEYLIPRPLLRWLMSGADLPRPNLSLCTIQLNREIFTPRELRRWPQPWPARTLIVAAGKGGLVPSADESGAARRLGEIGKRGNEGTRAVVQAEMRHPWLYQDGRLFARAVEAWCVRGEVLEGFGALG